jgi:hypothetical protein
MSIVMSSKKSEQGMSKVSAAVRSQIAKMGGEKSAAVRKSRPPRIMRGRTILISLRQVPQKAALKVVYWHLGDLASCST